jgi:hypothetical protein
MHAVGGEGNTGKYKIKNIYLSKVVKEVDTLDTLSR